MKTCTHTHKIAVFLLGVVLESAPVTYATTFYIDFQAGNDTAAGTSPATAWRTIPGTRTLNDTGYVTSIYGGGVVSLTAKVPAGTTFNLKSGSTYSGALGSYILIDTDFYTDGATTPAAIVFSRDTTWGTGPVTFDFAGTTNTVAGITAKIDGMTWNGNGVNGIVITHGARNGYQVKEKAGTRAKVRNLQFLNILFSANGILNTTDTMGASCGGLNIRNADTVEVSDCNFDGQANFVNGIYCADSGLSVINTTFRNCVAMNHKGDLVTDDAGIGFKAVNSQISLINCESHDNLKGFDLGEYLSGNANITYKIIDCASYKNHWGANFNNVGNNTYTGQCNFYLINSLIYSNASRGSFCYAGPFNLYVTHNVFAYNGGYRGSTSDDGHMRITSDGAKDNGEIHAYLYNNIFLGANPTVMSSGYFEPATNVISLHFDYNAYSTATNSKFFLWSYNYAGTGTQNRSFLVGTNGPGRASGNWYSWYGNSTVPPANGSGHFNCDPHSKGTGCSDTTLPPIADNFRPTNSYPGVTLSTNTWCIPEMTVDRAGKKRMFWDIGAFDYPRVHTPESPMNLHSVP